MTNEIKFIAVPVLLKGQAKTGEKCAGCPFLYSEAVRGTARGKKKGKAM